jgi:hypothetical protein
VAGGGGVLLLVSFEGVKGGRGDGTMPTEAGGGCEGETKMVRAMKWAER